MKTRIMKVPAHYSTVKASVNIRKRQLTTPEKSVPKKGNEHIIILPADQSNTNVSGGDRLGWILKQIGRLDW